jgi:CTP synthase
MRICGQESADALEMWREKSRSGLFLKSHLKSQGAYEFLDERWATELQDAVIVEGKIAAASYARENNIPCLGLCLGMQVMTIEYARNALGLSGAHSSEFDPRTPHPVIDLMETQRDVTEMGGTMRLGAYVAKLEAGSRVERAYGSEVVSERHRHRYEFNPKYRTRFDDSDFVCSGTSPDGRLVEFIELRNHPFWVGTQAHPEFKSRPERPAPLFREFVAAALARSEGRNPHLPDLDVDPVNASTSQS